MEKKSDLHQEGYYRGMTLKKNFGLAFFFFGFVLIHF